MNNKYKYLEKYSTPKTNVEIWKENTFTSISEDKIVQEEQRLGYKFPDQLKSFWLEIGYGNLTTPIYADYQYKCALDNEILSPSNIVDIILLKEDSGLILPDYVELIKDNNIPFFHISDSSDFLIMRPKSDNPNAVYDLAGRKIEDNFETFIYRLYHESPKYYLYVDDEK